jgi:hypothetical protein
MTRRRQAVEPTLFPFLAVLICTMGSLILMLAMVTQRARAAVATTTSELRESAENIARVQGEQEWLTGEYLEARQRQTEQLDRSRGELAHLEEHITRLREEFEDLQKQLQVAREADDHKAAAEQLRGQIAELEQRKVQLAAELAEKANTPGRPPRVVILPHLGPSGTARRPVYVECLADRLVVQPEGTEIPIELLRGPMGPGNPLAVALRTARSHWTKRDSQATEPPYPLLIVRPEGINSYAAARAAMEGWDDQFGYELVPDAVDLEFGRADSELRGSLERAVAAALQRQSVLIAGMPAAFRDMQPEQLISGPGGGLPAGQSTGSRGPTATSSSSRDGGAGFELGGNADLSSTGAVDGTGQEEVSAWRSSVQSALRGSGAGTRPQGSTWSNASGGGRYADSGRTTMGTAGDPTLGSSRAGGLPPTGGLAPGSGLAPSSGLPAGGSWPALSAGDPTAAQGAAGRASSGDTGNAGSAAGGSAGDVGASSATIDHGFANPGAAGGNAAGRQAPTDGSTSTDRTLLTDQATGSSPNNALWGSSSPSAAGGLPFGGTNTPPPNDRSVSPTLADAPSGSSVHSPIDSGDGSTGIASSGSGAPQSDSQRQRSISGADAQQIAQSASSTGLNQNSSPPIGDGIPPTDAELDAMEQQRQQAARNQRRRSTQVTAEDSAAVKRALIVGDLGTEAPSGPAAFRRVPLKVTADALQLPADNPRRKPVQLKIEDGRVGPAAVALAEQLRKQIASWGPPVSGGTWQVVVSADVAEDGEAVYADLQRLLSGSGVKLERKERP